MLPALLVAALSADAGNFLSLHPTNDADRVLIVTDRRAMDDYLPVPAVVQQMVDRGLTHYTGRGSVAEAWRSLVSTQDVVGVKVFSAGGEISGTRPAVAAAVVRGLLEAGLPRSHVIIWDRDADDLRAAGYFKLGKQLGVAVVSAVGSGYDPTNFYLPDSPVIGNLRYGDLEFGKKGKDIGKKSYVSLLVSRRLTKIISIAPLLNENDIGVCGQLYSVALGSVDNTFRFEGDPGRLAVAVPEIYALASLSDHVVFNITDALIGQYEGGPDGLLQYSEVTDQLWFSRDPVALDTLAVAELARARRARGATEFTVHTELYTNAVLLQLGTDDPAIIRIERVGL